MEAIVSVTPPSLSSMVAPDGQARRCGPLPMGSVVMLREKIAAEIAIEIAPHAVNVVSLVLCVVVLDQKCGRLDTVIMRIAFLNSSRPCKVEVGLCLAILLQAHVGDGGREIGR